MLQPADFKIADTEADGQILPGEWMRYATRGERPDRGGRGGGGIGEGVGGVKVGEPAPKVSAQFLKGDRVLDFSKIKRHTVVVFGSYT